MTMGLFSIFKKAGERVVNPNGPYKSDSTNLIYNLLFCDDLDLYKSSAQPPYIYPFDILYSDATSNSDLQKIIEDANADPRVKILAYNKQLASGHELAQKELLAVIVEVGLDEGLDVLASFRDGTARYINHREKILIWEAADERSIELKNDLYLKSQNIIDRIGPWDQPRRPAPTKGNVRITFLVSDGLYFGEGPTDLLFNDALAGPALTSATQLMLYLTQESLKK